jgi:hypothetical protein
MKQRRKRGTRRREAWRDGRNTLLGMEFNGGGEAGLVALWRLRLELGNRDAVQTNRINIQVVIWEGGKSEHDPN